MKQKSWFWGIAFIAAAVFIVGSQVSGAFVTIGPFSIILTVLSVALIISSVVSKEFFGIFIPAAVLYIIYDTPLKLPETKAYIAFSVAILLSIGFSILFRKKPPKIDWNNGQHVHSNFVSSKSENLDGDSVYAQASFSGSVKYLHSTNLTSGKFSCSFGSLDIYFDQAILNENGADIFVECSFGEMNLYIPRNWKVVSDVSKSFASFENNNNRYAENSNQGTVRITGNVSFGSIEIYYI